MQRIPKWKARSDQVTKEKGSRRGNWMELGRGTCYIPALMDQLGTGYAWKISPRLAAVAWGHSRASVDEVGGSRIKRGAHDIDQ